MSRIMLDEAIAAVYNDLARFPEQAPRRPVARTCSRCGIPGHYAKTCTASTTATLSRRADIPASLFTAEGEHRGATLSELAQLEEVVELQRTALAQHQSAERHWRAADDEDRADAAAWRADYVSGLLEQLRIELLGLRAWDSRQL